LIREAASAWVDDDATSLGAALAYYSLFSAAPVLLVVISIAGVVFGEQAAREAILGQIESLIGPASRDAVRLGLDSLDRPAVGKAAAALGVGVILFGATSVFVELQRAMDRIWNAPAHPTRAGFWGLVQSRLLSFGMVLAIGFLLIVSLVVSSALAAVATLWRPWFADLAMLAQVFDAVVSTLFLTALFAMIYKWLPRVSVAWSDVWLGAAITALLMALGKAAIGLYIGRSGVASAYGAAASVIALLLWVYYSSLIFLFGAELTATYSYQYGSRREAGPPVRQPPLTNVPA
jgi:membrane protein